MQNVLAKTACSQAAGRGSSGVPAPDLFRTAPLPTQSLPGSLQSGREWKPEHRHALLQPARICPTDWPPSAVAPIRTFFPAGMSVWERPVAGLAGLRKARAPSLGRLIFQPEQLLLSPWTEARFLSVQRRSPPRQVLPKPPGARPSSPLTWDEYVRSIMGQGLPPLIGEAQGVLVLSAFGKRGGQAAGEAQPSLGSQCPQHLG